MICDRCRNKAVYSRRYSGENLCSICFSNSILKKTAKTISKYRMIKNDDEICVAVSGGKDSLSLLQILNRMSKTHNFGITAVTIDEGIPGYRNEALKIVRNFCNNLKIKCKVYSYNDLYDLNLDEALMLRKNEKTSSCAICGTLRRKAMDFASKDLEITVMATAHNLDDMIQTFFINMLSGDTSKIGWMNPVNSGNAIRKIKPFCEIYESEIVFYSFVNNIPFQSESCPHMDEGIRTEIREFLNVLENHHSGIKNNLYRSMLKISEILNNLPSKQKTFCGNCGNESTGKICSVCNIVLKLKENQS